MACTETNMKRMQNLIDVFPEILPKKQTVRYLEVGLGLANGPLSSPYEPYVLSALIENAGIDYNGILLDSDPNVIDDILQRTEVHLPFSQMACCYTRNVWKAYLNMTDQSSSFNPDDKVKIQEKYENDIGKICAAKIPSSFEVGETIELILGNIQNQKNLGKFDFIISMNVFYHLNSDDQQKGLKFFSESLEKGGKILLSDQNNSRKNLPNNPLFSRFGGWIEKKSLCRYGLRLLDWHEKATDYGIAILGKR
jgi:SAM-dependent methyltransferase